MSTFEERPIYAQLEAKRDTIYTQLKTRRDRSWIIYLILIIIFWVLGWNVIAGISSNLSRSNKTENKAQIESKYSLEDSFLLSNGTLLLIFKNPKENKRFTAVIESIASTQPETIPDEKEK